MARNEADSGLSQISQEEQDRDESTADLMVPRLVRKVHRTDSSGVTHSKLIVSVYEVNTHRVLGKGSYGKVVLARKRESKRTYACKVMDIEQAPANFIDKFLPRELEILSQLHHPNVIQVYTYVKHYHMYYIFMDYCANGDLLRYLQRKGDAGESLSEEESRDKFVQILMGIKYLHRKQIAHRDLKCENILIDGPTLKLADFGFARFCISPTVGLHRRSSTHVGKPDIESFRSRKIAVLHTSDPDDEERARSDTRRRSRGRHSASAQLAILNELLPTITQDSLRSPSTSMQLVQPRRHLTQPTATMKSTSFCGSVAYASPEVLAGEEYEPKVSDMWSCGVILYILMMGKMPFDDSHPRKMLRRQRAKRYLEKVQGVLAESAVDLIKTLMEPNTSERSTVDEALLHAWLRPMYRKKLKQIITHEQISRTSVRSLSGTSRASTGGIHEIPLNDKESRASRHLSNLTNQSIVSTAGRSGHSCQSRSSRSVQSNYSAESKESHHSHMPDVTIGRKCINKF